MKDFESRLGTAGQHIFQLFFLGLLLVYSGCRKAPERTEPVRPVKQRKLEEPGLYKQLSYPATVKAFQQADLSFLVSGRLMEIPVRRGESIEEGQVLAQLDETDYRNEYESAKAFAEERKVYMQRVKEALDRKAATESEYDAAVRSYEMTEAKMQIAGKALADTVLKAPFAGEIGQQFKESYQDIAAKESIFRLQDVSNLKIVVDVPESVRLSVRQTRQEDEVGASPSQTYVIFDDLPGRRFEVEYYEDERTADPQTRTYAVTFLMSAPQPGLVLPGMSATLEGKVKLPAPNGEEGFAVPVSAIVSEAGTQAFAWVVDPTTQRVHKRPVKVAAVFEDQIQVLEGLHVGETIAISGTHHLREGMKVRPLIYQARRQAD